MQADHPDNGFSGSIRDDGGVEMYLWAKGKCVQTIDVNQKDLGNMAAMFLRMAHESAKRAKTQPSTQPGSQPDNPSIPISACGLIASKKKKTFALGFVIGEAQIAFQIPLSILAHLGRQLLAASAQEDQAH